MLFQHPPVFKDEHRAVDLDRTLGGKAIQDAASHLSDTECIRCLECLETCAREDALVIKVGDIR